MCIDLRKRTRPAVVIPLIVCVAAMQSAAAADTAPQGNSENLEEIVVTAQHRSEKIMDVPMSIQALSQEKLDQQGLRNVDDLARVAPGVTFLRNGMGATGNYNDEGSDISIRGIDSSAGASTTGIYVDDTPIQTRHLNFGTLNPFPALFDLERVEVLKGPQGTLFGAGSEGGTVRFITPEASLSKYTGYARAELGLIHTGGTSYEAGAAFGGPLVDGLLGFRISASYRKDGGWVDRASYAAPPSAPGAQGSTVYTGAPTVTGITERNANWRDVATARAALKWQPRDDLSIDPSIYVQTLHINDTSAYWLNLSDPAGSLYRNGNAQRNPSTDPWYIAALKVSWDLPTVHLSSSTSYYSRAQHSISDYSQWLPTIYAFDQYHYTVDGQTATAFFTDRQDNFTEELRAVSADPQSRLQWTAGLYYAHVHENSTEYIVSADLPLFLGLATAPQPGFIGYHQPQFSMVDRQVAAYGELTFKLAEPLTVTAGLRYSKLTYDGAIVESGALLLGNSIVSTSSGSDKPLTPRLVVKYQPNADSLIYASAAKGFRPGGINATLPPNCTAGLPTEPTTFTSDSLWHYELGAKNSLLERTLQISASVYYLKWKNIQQFVYLTCGLGFDYNLGEVTGKGGDIEISWRPTPNLQLGLTGAYTTTSYDGNVALAGVYPLVTAGNHLPGSPWNLNLVSEYSWNTDRFRPYLHFDYQFATAQRSLLPYQDPGNAPNYDPTSPGLPQIRMLGLRAGLRSTAGLDLSMFVQNALNYHTPTFVSRDLATAPLNGYPSNFDTNYFGRGYAPRTIGVTTTYRF